MKYQSVRLWRIWKISPGTQRTCMLEVTYDSYILAMDAAKEFQKNCRDSDWIGIEEFTKTLVRVDGKWRGDG